MVILPFSATNSMAPPPAAPPGLLRHEPEVIEDQG